MSASACTCDYLAQLGYRHLLGTPHQPDDEDDPESIADARQLDHARVLDRLLDTEPKPLTDRSGAAWIRPITWPDRVPGLVTRAGRQSLADLIRRRQLAIRWEGEPKLHRARDLRRADPLTLQVPMRGSSGIDADACPDAIDAGFSLDVQDMPIMQRPAAELLAILGLETVPLVSFARRECGFVAAGRLWRFAVESRTGGYYHRWGELREVDWGPTLRRWAELDARAGASP